MKIKRFIICLFVLNLGIQYTQAQNAILTSGGDIKGEGGSVSFSTGQLVSSTYISENASVAQGVQQTYMIIDLTEDFVKNDEKLNCSVYPNPVVNFLVLSLDNNAPNETSTIEYLLFDVNGNQLIKKQVFGNQDFIDMGKLSASTYFLKVVAKETNHGMVKESTFKIIKQ